MRPLLAALAALLAAPVGAQPLVSDRPGFATSPATLAPGRLQVELGATFASVSPLGGLRTSELSAPGMLVRFGLAPGFELRATPPDYVRLDTETFDLATDGFTDPSVGVKADVGTFGGVDVGVVARATIPVGEDGFTEDRVVPSLVVAGGGDLTETVSFGAQAEAAFYGEENAPFGGSATLGGVVALGYALNARTGVFAELVLEDEVGGVIDPYSLVHTGATRLLSPDAQVDVHAGIGLAGYAPDYLVGVGASVRI